MKTILLQMKPLAVFFGIFISLNSLNAQVFAFVQDQNGTSSGVPGSSYKLAVASKVFNDLLRARGELRMQTPSLLLIRQEKYVAWMDPENVVIGMEEKAYDICTSFGADSIRALAALLSHELTHYYEKHDWNRHFARENENIQTSQQLERQEEGLKHEAQADYLGGFLAYSAGYNTYGVMPELLRKVYQSYRLPDKLSGYPSLGDRLEMVQGAMARLKELCIVFDIAQQMTVLGNYETAATYYQNILKSYQSCEIYNNAGVNTVLAALDYFSPKEMPYILPLELDPNTRLKGMRGIEADRLEKRKSILQHAARQFDQAISLDENYLLAYLNKACALTLMGEYDEAEFLLKKALKKSKDPVLSTDIMVMQGIGTALQGDTGEAVQQLELAKSKGGRLAEANLNIVQNKPVTGNSVTPAPVTGVEQIEKFNLDDFLANPGVDKEIEVSAGILCGEQQRAQSSIFIHYADGGKQYAVIQVTKPEYTGTTLRGIKLKSTTEDIRKTYGPPRSMVATPSGMVWLYPEAKIYFRLNIQDQVESWGVYTKS